MRILLPYHIKKYPKMQNQDKIKLIYQASLGPAHLINKISEKKAYKYAKHFNCPIALVDKRRDGNDDKAVATSVVGEIEGKNAIIFDDEVDTAGSIMETIHVIKQSGAKDIYVGCTHGILSGPAVERIEKSELKELVMTSTVPLPEYKRIDKIKVVSISGLFAEAIRRIHMEKSMGELFDTFLG